MRHYWTLLILFLAHSSCSIEESYDEQLQRFVYEDFPKSSKLEQLEIMLPDMNDPIKYFVLHDTLLVVNNWSALSGYYAELYNLKDTSLIAKFGKRGNGPNELLSCDISVNHTEDGILSISDVTGLRMSIYEVNSLTKGDTIPKSHFRIPDYSRNGVVIGSNLLIFYNTYYFEESGLENNMNMLFKFDATDQSTSNLARNDLTGTFFTYNVSDGHPVASLKRQVIFIASHFENQIHMYDFDLNHIKSFEGPFSNNNEYYIRENSENHISMKHGRYLAYNGLCANNDGVYIFFIGEKGESRYNKEKYEIFKFSWDGDLMEKFEVDNYIRSMSLSEDGRYLFATVRDADMGLKDTPKLIKYELP